MNATVQTNDYDNIKPLHNLTVFLSLASSKNAKWWHMVYSILILIALNSFGILNMFPSFYENVTQSMSTAVIRLIATNAILLFVNISIIKFSLCTRYKKKYNKFLDTFTNFPIKRRSFIWVQIIAFNFIYGLGIISNIKVAIFLQKSGYPLIYYFMTILNYLLSISHLVIVNYVVLLKARFEEINTRLKSIFPIDLDNTASIVSKKRMMRSGNGISNSVKSIRKSYTLLSKTVKRFNQLFGVQILILYFYIFIQLLDCINILIIVNKQTNKLEEENYLLSFHMLTSVFLWACNLLIMGVAVAVTCDMTTKKAQNTATVCYNLLLDVPTVSNNVQDRILRKELILLAQQATHQYPYFSAAGFFNVNYSLLLGLLGTVTSYVIVLIQINQ